MLALLATGSLLLGGDVSEIPRIEDEGGRYRSYGREQDPFALMKQAGWNWVRFRIWNEPKDGYCDKEATLRLAKRAHAQGLRISLDFHYSDWWADPGKQNKPAAWKDLPFDGLEKAVYDYTKEVVGAMIAQGTRPYMVQVGNEVIGGMLWPDGKVSSNEPEGWKRFGRLLKSGLKAVRDAQGEGPKIHTMIHIDRGGENNASVWFFDHLAKQGVEFDAIGQSYYPFWHGSLSDLRENLNDLARRYRKDVYVVETAYPWKWDEHPGPHVYNGGKLLDGFPATPEGQAAFVAELKKILREVPGGRGKGLLYWAPTWITTPKDHSDYENLATFDENGNALPAFRTLGERRL
ncbi:MAG TPA: glycosyl hydrolase 53 family protein [Fimbriimonas sp.]